MRGRVIEHLSLISLSLTGPETNLGQMRPTEQMGSGMENEDEYNAFI